MPNPTKPTTDLTREHVVDAVADLLYSNKTARTSELGELMQLFDVYIQAKEREARIEQSYRCRELIEANANSPEDAERYGDIVLLDVDDLVDELQDALETRNA